MEVRQGRFYDVPLYFYQNFFLFFGEAMTIGPHARPVQMLLDRFIKLKWQTMDNVHFE